MIATYKVDEGKAMRILEDPEVKAALSVRRNANAEGPYLALYQEGFVHHKELEIAYRNGRFRLLCR